MNPLAAALDCRAYDLAFAEEVVVVEAYRRGIPDALFHITLSGEELAHPGLAASAHDDIIRGMYLLRPGAAHARRVQLLGGGAIMGEILKAAAQLEHVHAIAADVWSVTSYPELAREGVARERDWRHGRRHAVDSWFEQRLAASTGPIVAATDHVRALPELVRAFIPPRRRYLTLGTAVAPQGNSRAEQRANAEVDATAIVQASLRAVDEIVSAEKIVERRRLADVMSLSSI